MSGLGLLGSMFAGGVGGAAETKLETLKAEAKKVRDENLLKLGRDYNIEVADHQDANARARDQAKIDNEVSFINGDQTKAITGAEYAQLSPEEQAGYMRMEALNAQMAMAKNKADIARLNRADAKDGNKDTIKYNDDGSFTVYNPDTRTARTVHTRESAAAAAKELTDQWAAKEGEGLLNFEPSDEEKKTHYEQTFNELMADSGQPTGGGGGQPGQIVRQNGQLYQISADGKSATPYRQETGNGNSEGKKQAQSTSSSKDQGDDADTPAIDRKVQYQIAMGDARDPSVIAAEIKKSEAAEQKKNKKKPKSKPVEDLASLPAATRAGILRQAKSIKEIENDTRSLDDIVQAILEERAKG